MHGEGGVEGDICPMLNISTIILQSSCSNLQSFIKPLTILDNILTNNVLFDNKIADNKKDYQILKGLFDSYLAKEQYVGNEYIWSIFNAFVNYKHKIDIHLDRLGASCKNKDLLGLILSDTVKMKYVKPTGRWDFKEEEYLSDKYRNKNLLKPEILSIFQNVTDLRIGCNFYPLSLESLLVLIKNTQIRKVEIWGPRWLPKVKAMSSFSNILSQYKQENLNMEFKDHKETKDSILIITCNK